MSQNPCRLYFHIKLTNKPQWDPLSTIQILIEIVMILTTFRQKSNFLLTAPFPCVLLNTKLSLH